MVAWRMRRDPTWPRARHRSKWRSVAWPCRAGEPGQPAAGAWGFADVAARVLSAKAAAAFRPGRPDYVRVRGERGDRRGRRAAGLVAMSQTVTLLVERKLSDGNYGSQGFSLGLTITVADTEPLTALVEREHANLLEMVLERLAASPNGRVSYTAQRELHADEDQARAEAWAMSNASAEESNIRHMDDDDGLENLPF